MYGPLAGQCLAKCWYREKKDKKKWKKKGFAKLIIEF